MKLSRGAIALYVGLVFASGAVLGAFGHRLYTVSTVSAKGPKNSEEFRKLYMEENKARLNLSPEQIAKWEFLLDESRVRTREAFRRLDPEIQTIRSEQIQKIEDMLKPEQRTEYEKLRKEREERNKKNPGRPGHGGL